MEYLAHATKKHSNELSNLDSAALILGALVVFLLGVLLGMLLSQRKDIATAKRKNTKK